MLPYDEIFSITGDNGLSDQNISIMREKFGKNELTPPKREPLWKQYLEKFDDPIIKILLVAIVISIVVSLIQGVGIFDTLGIIVAVLLATAIAFINEYRSSKEFEVLNSQRNETGIKVIRGGHTRQIAQKEVVVGDLVILEAGDGIPADGYLLSVDNVYIDEAVFTGESDAVQKRLKDPVLKGSYITCGRGHLLVAAVGDKTEMGEIAASLGVDHSTQTPLEEKLEHLAGMISKFGYIMATLIVIALVFRGLVLGDLTGLNLATVNNILNYFMLAVVIIVVAVPEGLPMSVALSLSIAMRKMTKANSLVRKLIACETIGSATTICTDKTGTLTKNQMEVVETSIGLPHIPDVAPKTPEEWITFNAALNSTAALEERDNKKIVIGSSTEGALLLWLEKSQINYDKMRHEFPIKKQYLFDGNRKRMSTVIEIENKRYLLVKGAPEIIAELCDEKIDLTNVLALASRAMRTLAFAHKEIDNDESESHLIWDGFFGIRDHIRENVPDAVKSCADAGIRVRMVTGDNIETARAIAKETGILRGGSVITGKEFRELTEDQRENRASDIDVMARAEPMDKLLLVKALQKKGDVVAVTGDGTNDAPALKHADVGLAMGISGTEVSREASDIVLLDDSFPTIVNAVWWGRALYENIQRFLVFQLTINFSACILAFIAPLMGYPSPFTIIQLLWINIIMDSLAAVALCSEAPHRALLKNKPVSRDAKIITTFMWRSIIITGAFFIVAGLVNMQTGFLGGNSPLEKSTIFFAAFVIAQVWNGINCRAINGIMPPFFKGNPTFFIVMGIIVISQILLVQFGGDIVGTVPLSPTQWIFIGIFSASVLIVGQLIRWTSPQKI
jgi:Ca2+-transporting ATPase